MSKKPTERKYSMTPEELEMAQKRKKEIEEQRLVDPKYQTRPLGKSPKAELGRLQPFSRDDIVAKAKDPRNRVDIFTRPSHRKSQDA